jgi:molecular chaperone DnaJ
VVLRVVPHPFYRQEGELLICEVPVAMTDAALGAEIEVPLLDARVRMRVPPGTQSGAVFRIRGKGLPSKSGLRGDAHVRILVEVPTSLPPDARAQVERLAETLADAAYPRRRAFLDASREESPASDDSSERKSG